MGICHIPVPRHSTCMIRTLTYYAPSLPKGKTEFKVAKPNGFVKWMAAFPPLPRGAQIILAMLPSPPPPSLHPLRLRSSSTAPALGCLSACRCLDGNQLSGTVPASLGSLISLRALCAYSQPGSALRCYVSLFI